MHYFVVAVDRWREDSRHPVERFDGFFHARAEASRRGEQNSINGHDFTLVTNIASSLRLYAVSGALISSVAPNSPAGLSGVTVGERLLSVNGRSPSDIIEYQQLIDGPHVELLLQRDGDPLARKVSIDKLAGERLGIAVDSAIFDRIRTCDNHCTFCFIYQLPKGLRRSLYVKDDDFRLSFLYGNYTTLTRFTEFDLERIIDEKLSPLYVSIHTTNPDLRASMLRNPRGATSLRWLRELLAAGIEVHGQVVVCPGVNDGDELIRTLDDVLTQYRDLATVSLVPLGISDFSNESTMRSHTAEEAEAVVALVEQFQGVARELLGRPLVFASDEYHLLALRPAPSADTFDSLDQAENGVGLVAAFVQSFASLSAMDKLGTGFFQSVDGAPAWGYRAPRTSVPDESTLSGPLTVLTGEYAQPILRELLDEHGFADVDVVGVKNTYFGGNIKVAGLLTGSDIQRVVGELGQSRTYLLPDLCLSEDVFLDGLSISDIDAHVITVPTTGVALRERLTHAARIGASQ
jgi:putative radical SAM enzyme (TIGR03279 family)